MKIIEQNSVLGRLSQKSQNRGVGRGRGRSETLIW